MTPEFEKMWQEIEENFNWNRVYLAMKAVDWQWSFGNNDYGIPTIPTLKHHAKERALSVYKAGKGTSSSGGFMAGYTDGDLWLLFSLEEHTAYGPSKD